MHLDEKPSFAASPTPPRRPAPMRLSVRHILLSVAWLASAWYLVCLIRSHLTEPTSTGIHQPADFNPGHGLEPEPKRLVPLEAHIMSKCPDAKDCLREMILPVMQRVSDKVNFTLSFIGTPTANDGVSCRHGPRECMGNIIELCAFELYPNPKISLGFTMCITRDYAKIPDRDLIEDCALEHAIDVKALNDCAAKGDGAHGIDMLRRSVMRTKEAGVTKSCTVRLNEEIYCVRDNAEWAPCPGSPSVDALVSSIEEMYRSPPPHSA